MSAADESPPANPPMREDGRRRRSVQTRQLIIEAYMALIREEPQIPTAAQIAERAGCSVRSIFERFPDLIALRVAATDHAFTQAIAEVPVLRGLEGDRQTRIRTYVETRAATCERWLPLWRVISSNQSDSVELKSRVLLMRQAILKRVELTYEPELSTLDRQERRQILIAIEALVDFESWGRMREDNGLGIDEACTVWIQALDRLLPPAPSSSWVLPAEAAPTTCPVS